MDPSSEEFRQHVFQERGLTYAITMTGGSAQSPAIKLKDSTPELRLTNEIHDEEIVSQSEWTKTLINNGFTEASVKALFPMVSTELAVSRARVNLIFSADSKQSYHRVIYYSQAFLNLRKEVLEPTDEFVTAVNTALNAPSIMDRYQQLKIVFERFGFVWAQKVTLGGKLTLSEKLMEYQYENENKVQALAKAKASVSSTIAELGQVGAGAGFKVEREKGAGNSSDFLYQRSHLNVIGGQATSNAFDNGRAGWEKSLKDPYSWRVIIREDLIPIYELLDEETQATLKTVIDAAISIERVTTNSTFTLRNHDTNHSLSWKKFYYGKARQYPGMVVTTCPMLSGDTNENMQWKFVRSVSSQERSPYVCYGDSIYIKPATISGPQAGLVDRLFLHGSYHQDAPVSTDGKSFEVSLRYFGSVGPNENDEWVIERGDDAIPDNGGDIDIESNMRKTSFVHKSDRFRLRHRATDQYYLASHQVTLENIRVRRNPKEIHAFMPPYFKDIKGGGEFSNRFNEVLLREREALAGTKCDRWEFFRVE
ncbi:hypothetical protein BC937DRAFT_90781 [Endogone sp. FLAS-F59071]|nr:hypothetical protein BC937DRAFT_90781 [Endogone sp. FLAS-F59071]|eukprot:RUS23197.1 hypothetical protein BC937DRAFT_90781 [Endogone sp. FLAS-F59071]